MTTLNLSRARFFIAFHKDFVMLSLAASACCNQLWECYYSERKFKARNSRLTSTWTFVTFSTHPSFFSSSRALCSKSKKIVDFFLRLCSNTLLNGELFNELTANKKTTCAEDFNFILPPTMFFCRLFAMDSCGKSLRVSNEKKVKK